jgi:hypothetical protein
VFILSRRSFSALKTSRSALKAADRDGSLSVVHTIDAFLSIQKQGVRTVSQLSYILKDILSSVEDGSHAVFYDDEPGEICRSGVALDGPPPAGHASGAFEPHEANESAHEQPTFAEELQRLDERNLVLTQIRPRALRLFANPDIWRRLWRFGHLGAGGPSHLDSPVHDTDHQLQVRQAHIAFQPNVLHNLTALNIPSFLARIFSNNYYNRLLLRVSGIRSTDRRCILYVTREGESTPYPHVLDAASSKYPYSRTLPIPLRSCLITIVAFIAYILYLSIFGPLPASRQPEFAVTEHYRLRAIRDAYIRREFRPERWGQI